VDTTLRPMPGFPPATVAPAAARQGGRARAALLVLTGLAALLAVRFTFGLGSERLEAVADGWVYHGVMLGAAALCLARRALPWMLLGSALLAWTVGSVYWTFFLDLGALPAFSAADVLWLGFYPLVYAALFLLRAGRQRHTLWLDGLISALALAAAGAALLLGAVLEATRDERLGIVAVNLAYPLADLVLIALVVGALGAAGWHAGPMWWLLAGGLMTFAVADAIYLHQVAVDAYAVGSLVDLGWLLGAVVLAWAAWRPPLSLQPAQEGVRVLLLPAGFALLALAVLVYDHFVRVNAVAVALAAAALLAVIVRLTLIFHDKLVLVSAARRDAHTDSLTGLWNRRRLVEDLESRLGAPQASEAVLVLFDLDGFKLYNDTFGHLAGDALLERIGSRLEAAVPAGAAYRMGGDEFCALLEGDGIDPEQAAAALASAIADAGNGFWITACYGFVRLGDEAATASDALRLADHRMYARKGRSPHSLMAQTTSVLLRTLEERSESLERHAASVARLADAAAAAMGLSAEERDRLHAAALLHDVGNLVLPDHVLEKLDALDAPEWELVRRHTVAGERILRAAPALASIAPAVRATHERFDGQGYPDGLAGDEIPLAARIILACDAYDAMVSPRSYAASFSPEEALAELERCAGAQFDPEVVAALRQVLAPQAGVAGAV
jgi:two-component system, cell cycle response regulator